MSQFRQFNLTLDGTAQALSVALPGVEDLSIENIGFRQLKLQADDGNSNPIFIGDSEVTVDIYGLFLPLPPGNVPGLSEDLGPFEAGPVKLSEIFAIGTSGEILNIVGVTW